MSKISYSVFARIKHLQKAEEWIAWLRGGHIAEVKQGGALEGIILKHDTDENTGTLYEVQYIFPDRHTFDHYVAVFAPALREEGLQKFPPEDGFEYHRTIKEIMG